ncbi:MAG: hypothetical protein CMF39_05280 [Legionellaceae bacterium]|nr:hypothetical protein [Legionellaceae bacterium]|tara:strand:+ start:884 stop:1261 length:378 start_codon:yes stop_codon:yes gene_type:complete
MAAKREWFFQRLFNWLGRFAEEVKYIIGQQDKPEHLKARGAAGLEIAGEKPGSTSSIMSRFHETYGSKPNRPKSPTNGRLSPILTHAPQSRSTLSERFSSFMSHFFPCSRAQQVDASHQPQAPRF